MLSYQDNRPEKTFQKILSSKVETQINLNAHVPVTLTYRTVFFDDYNQPQYRSDIYGRDALVYMYLLDAGIDFDI